MKILQINSVCGYGSTGRIVADLYHAIKAEGQDCVVAYGRKEAPAEIETVKIGSSVGVAAHGILSRLTDKHGFYSRTATKQLLYWMKNYSPDVVHLHNLHGYYLNIELLFHFLKEEQIPVVWTLHDCWGMTGHCSYFSYAGCDKWKTGCSACPQQKEYPTSLLLDRSSWNYQKKRELFSLPDELTLVTPSEWLAGIVRDSFLQKYPVQVISNGLDLEQFRPTPSDFHQNYGLTDKKLILGVANIWEKRKGLHDFVALSQLLTENWRIVMVGLSERQKANLPKNIIALSRTESSRELAGLYTTADVYFNASREETMGLTTVEALACGTPAVVYDTTALPEAVDEGCGAVVPCGDLRAVLNAVNHIQSNAVLCRKRAEERYDKKKEYMKYVSLHYDVYQKRHSR